MDPNVVFIRDTCPGEKYLDLLSRPVGLCPNNGKCKGLASEDRTVVHASSIGIGVAARTDGRAVPARRLTPARVDRSARWRGPCVRQGRADNDRFGADRSF